ncbi:MAG: type II secretion system protein [bacterium]|nr:type II secretion system protein [bacterium]
MKKNRGFTLIELLIVVATVFMIVVVFGAGIVGTLCMGNQWFTEDGVLRKIQVNHPSASQVVDVSRKVFRHSVITVNEAGQKKQYCLDSDIMFDYEVTECK